MHSFLYYYGGRLSHAEVLGGWEKITRAAISCGYLRCAGYCSRAQQSWCARSVQGSAPAARGLLARQHHKTIGTGRVGSRFPGQFPGRLPGRFPVYSRSLSLQPWAPLALLRVGALRAPRSSM